MLGSYRHQGIHQIPGHGPPYVAAPPQCHRGTLSCEDGNREAWLSLASSR